MKYRDEALSRIGITLAVMIMILGCFMLVVSLSSCGSEHVTLEDGTTLISTAWERDSKACMEFGYPDHITYSDGTVFCLRRSECSDDVVKLATLQSRERG